jgi:hypothetical protein
MTIQAYLSENYAIGIWAASSAIKENKSKSMEKMAEFHYYLGISYLGKNRTEEAISVLKKIVFYENYNQIDREILEKSHMALIQAYSENNKNQKNNQNITYLIRLFKARHNKSNMVFNIQDWNGKRYVR